MENILQELYHGMIHPEEEYQPTQERRQERNELTARQAALLERLQKADPALRLETEMLLEAANALDAMDMEEAYIQGMRMGARLALALLGEKEA